MTTPSRRKRVARDGSSPTRRTAVFDTTLADCEAIGREMAKDRAGPFVSENPDTDALCASAMAEMHLRKRIRAELRGSFAAYGLSKAQLVEILRAEADVLMGEIEADLRATRRLRWPR